MIRRIVTLCLCAGAFWLGMQVQTMQSAAACRGAGGSIDARGLCVGVSK